MTTTSCALVRAAGRHDLHPIAFASIARRAARISAWWAGCAERLAEYRVAPDRRVVGRAGKIGSSLLPGIPERNDRLAPRWLRGAGAGARYRSSLATSRNRAAGGARQERPAGAWKTAHGGAEFSRVKPARGAPPFPSRTGRAADSFVHPEPDAELTPGPTHRATIARLFPSCVLGIVPSLPAGPAPPRLQLRHEQRPAYDANTGAFLGALVPSGSGGLEPARAAPRKRRTPLRREPRHAQCPALRLHDRRVHRRLRPDRLGWPREPLGTLRDVRARRPARDELERTLRPAFRRVDRFAARIGGLRRGLGPDAGVDLDPRHGRSFRRRSLLEPRAPIRLVGSLRARLPRHGIFSPRGSSLRPRRKPLRHQHLPAQDRPVRREHRRAPRRLRDRRSGG